MERPKKDFADSIWSIELFVQGLWPVPIGVTVYRFKPGYRPTWRVLPDPEVTT